MCDKLAIGTVQLGMAYGANNLIGLPTEEDAAAIIHASAAAGVPMLDTAHGYGISEARIGRALAQLPAVERPWVVTKVDASCNDAPDDTTAADIVATGLRDSRERLQVSCLDTALLHHFRQYTDHGGAAWRVLREAKARGEIQRIGASMYEPEEVYTALADPEMQHIQLPFNLLVEKFKTDAFTEAITARPDVVVHVRSCYLQGILVSDRSRWPAFAVRSGLADQAIRALEGLTLELNRDSRVDLALAYCRGQPWVSQVVLGVETIEQLQENLQSFQRPPLTAAEIARVDEVVAELNIPPRLLSTGDWGEDAVGFTNGQNPADGRDDRGQKTLPAKL